MITIGIVECVLDTYWAIVLVKWRNAKSTKPYMTEYDGKK